MQEYSFHSQSLSDISPAQADASHINPDPLPYPSVDCIPACRDTPVPYGILQRQVLPGPKAKPWLFKEDVPSWPNIPKLQTNVPPWPDIPKPQPKPRLSLKRIRSSKVHTSPDAISYQDSPWSGLGVSSEVETCIPSLAASLDLNDATTCSSEVKDALSCVKSALSHAYAVLEHSLTCDIKLHPSDKSHLNSPPLSVISASPKSLFDKVAPVQHGSSTHNLCPKLYTGKKEKLLSHLGDKAIGNENTCQPMVSTLIPQGSIDHSPNHAQSLASFGRAYRPSLLSSKSLSIPVYHDENAHYGVPCSPYLVPPPTDMDKPQSYKWNPGTKKLYGCDTMHPGPTASCLYRDKILLAKATCPSPKKTCRACAVPSHEFLSKFLSQIDMSSDVLRESDLLPETVFDLPKYIVPRRQYSY